MTVRRGSTHARVLAAMVLAWTCLSVAACDPVYRVGASSRLSAAAPIACWDSALSRSSRVAIQDRRPYRDDVSFGLLLRDSSSWRNVELRVTPAADSVQVAELTTSWMGTARTVPLERQRQFVALATNILAELQSYCATATARIDCHARGLGGQPACQ